MGLVCLDANTSIWGIKEWCTPGQELEKQKSIKLIRRLSQAGYGIIIPSMVLAELTTPMNDADRNAFINDVSKKCRVAYMDPATTSILGRMLNHYYLHKPSYKNVGISKKCMKYDVYIIASAIAHGAECIYSNDGDFQTLADGFIEIKGLDDMPTSYKQPGEML